MLKSSCTYKLEDHGAPTSNNLVLFGKICLFEPNHPPKYSCRLHMLISGACRAQTSCSERRAALLKPVDAPHSPSTRSKVWLNSTFQGCIFPVACSRLLDTGHCHSARKPPVRPQALPSATAQCLPQRTNSFLHGAALVRALQRPLKSTLFDRPAFKSAVCFEAPL